MLSAQRPCLPGGFRGPVQNAEKRIVTNGECVSAGVGGPGRASSKSSDTTGRLCPRASGSNLVGIQSAHRGQGAPSHSHMGTPSSHSQAHLRLTRRLHTERPSESQHGSVKQTEVQSQSLWSRQAHGGGAQELTFLPWSQKSDAAGPRATHENCGFAEFN